MSPPSRNPGWSAADELLLGEVRQALGETYELVGAVGRDRHGLPALIAREAATGELVVLLLDRAPDAEGGPGELALVERRTLDETIPAPGIPCPSCRAPQQAWTHDCAVCGSEVDGAAHAKGLDPAQLLGMVQRATAAEMDVLGVLHHAGTGDGPGAPVYFARERSTRDLMALRLSGRTVGADGQSDITLGVIALPALGLPGGGGAELEEGAARPESRATPPPGIATVSLLREALEAAAAPAPAEARVCPQCGAEYPPGVRFCARDGAALRARNAGNDLTNQIVADKYLVLRKLGVGGMGEVYLARHVHMGRECALKIMRRELTDDVDAAGRFRREAASASRVNHPNIATIYDFGETSEGIAYIVMEYVDGEPLSAILAREGKLEPARAVTIARQIADALGAAHELGIVHRDLKPDNVMVGRGRAGTDEVKVVDFGIAKAIQGGSRQLTRTGYVLGTPAYMSPEQILGEDLDGRSDQYNLACILFEMLTGQVTFAGPTGEIVIHRRLSEPPPHPRKLNPAVPRALDEVVVHALARTAAERFANAAELGAALAEAIEPRGARWSPLSWFSRERSAPAREAPAAGRTGGRGTPAQARATPDPSAPPASSTGILVPRVRPPTGSAPSTGISRIAPTPEPPTSPPLARPKWPAGESTPMPDMSDPTGASGERVSVPAGSPGTERARELWSGTAVTGERAKEQTGERAVEQTGERRLELGTAGAAASVGLHAAPESSVSAPAARPVRSRTWFAGAGGVLLAAGAAGAVVWVAQRPSEPENRSAPAANAIAEPGAPGVSANGTPADSAGALAGTGASAGTPGAGAPGDSTAPAPEAAPSEGKLVAELEAQIARQAALARAARARAVAAGASPRALVEGDSLLGASLALQARGDYTSALRDGIAASQSWALAERTAEARRAASGSSTAIANTPGAPASTEPPATPSITPSMSPASSSSSGAGPTRQTVPPPASQNVPPAPPTTKSATDVAAASAAAAAGALRDYVSALSRRDLAEMQKLLPTMPANTADAFRQLFEQATKFSATLSAEPAPRVDGPSADAELRYTLDYFIPAQGAVRRSFHFRAVMRRDGDRWTIRSLEPIR